MLIRFFSPKAARETTTVLGGHLAYVCGGLVLSKLLAYHLGPNGFGEWALVYSIVGVINLLAHGPVGQWLLRFYSLWRLEGALGSYEKFSSLLLSYGFLAGSFLLVPLVFNLELRLLH